MRAVPVVAGSASSQAARGADGMRQIQIQQQGKEQKEAGDFCRKLPSVLEDQFPDVGDVRHDGIVVGVFSRLRCRMMLRVAATPARRRTRKR